MAGQLVDNLEIQELDPALASVFAVRFTEVGDGPRVAIKDVMDIAGVPTRAGSRALENAPPAQHDAAIVKRLREAGCRIVGKTHLHELAYGVTGLNGWCGTPINPKFPNVIPGGSSSGSAVAVASEHCDFALGTDTGGSVRVPATCCGIYGLKTTFGRIARTGLSPERSSLDCVGPLAPSAIVLDIAMAAMDPSWRSLPDVASPQIGIVQTETDGRITTAINAAARLLDPGALETSLEGMDSASDAGLTIIARETYAAFAPLLATGKVGADVAGRLARAEDISDARLNQAEEERSRFTAAVDQALEGLDALALPALPHFPPPVKEAGDLMAALNITALTRPFNLSGHPAVTLPLDPIENSPCSLQLVGRKGDDERLVALAVEFAHLTDHDVKPG